MECSASAVVDDVSQRSDAEVSNNVESSDVPDVEVDPSSAQTGTEENITSGSEQCNADSSKPSEISGENQEPAVASEKEPTLEVEDSAAEAVDVTEKAEEDASLANVASCLEADEAQAGSSAGPSHTVPSQHDSTTSTNFVYQLKRISFKGRRSFRDLLLIALFVCDKFTLVLLQVLPSASSLRTRTGPVPSLPSSTASSSKASFDLTYVAPTSLTHSNVFRKDQTPNQRRLRTVFRFDQSLG